MDNIDCLKKFTEDIVKKQTDSMESLKILSQAIETVGSDITNLINSLQMVGDRQFAESRIQEDNSLLSGDPALSPPNSQGDSMQVSPQSHIPHSGSHCKSGYDELSLCEILHRAVEMLPLSEDEDEVQEQCEQDVEILEKENEEIPDLEGEDVPEVAETSMEVGNDARGISTNDTNTKQEVSISRKHESIEPLPHRLPIKIGSMDRDRVANILKKYSLYDDDEDDDGDSE